MKRILLLSVLVVLLSQSHFDKACQSYGFDKGAILTLEGVMCERSVRDSFTTAYLPLNGARLEFEYSVKPDPRYILPAPQPPQG